MVENFGGDLLELPENGSRYDAVLENFLEWDGEGIESSVKFFYIQQGFKLSSDNSVGITFSKKGIVKLVVWTYDSLGESLKVRCDTLG